MNQIIKSIVIAMLATLMVACGAAKQYPGDVVRQFDTPSIHREHIETLSGDGRRDQTEIIRCADDYCAGQALTALYASGAVRVNTREEAVWATMHSNPGSEECKTYEVEYTDSSVETKKICKPVTNDVPNLQYMSVSPTQSVAPRTEATNNPAPRARSQRRK
jgi:hypothetical protein